MLYYLFSLLLYYYYYYIGESYTNRKCYVSTALQVKHSVFALKIKQYNFL